MLQSILNFTVGTFIILGREDSFVGKNVQVKVLPLVLWSIFSVKVVLSTCRKQTFLK